MQPTFDRAPIWKPALVIVLGGWIAFVAVPLSLGGFPAAIGHDLDLAIFAARLGSHEGWSRLYDLSLQGEYYRSTDLGTDFGPANYYGSPPQYAWLVLPLALLPRSIAHFVWFVTSIAALGATWWLIRPARDTTGLLITVLASVAWYPVLDTLHFGQLSLLLSASIAASWRLLQRSDRYLGGVALVPLILKPQLGLLFPILLLIKRRYRALQAWVAGVALVEIPAAVMLGKSGLAQYAHVLAVLQSGRLNRILGFAGWLPFPVAIALQFVAASAAVVVIARQSMELAYVAAILGSILASSYLHTQDLALLVPAAWLILATCPASAYHAALGVGWFLGEFLLPLGPLPFLAFQVVALGWMVGLSLREVVVARARTSAVGLISGDRRRDRERRP